MFISTAYRNLYESQKLLALNVNLESQFFKVEQLSANKYWMHSSESKIDFLPILTVILIAVGALFIIYKYYKSRNRPRRRRTARLKRFLSTINAKKVPSV